MHRGFAGAEEVAESHLGRTYNSTLPVAHVQEEMFAMVGRPITDSCLQGYNACLLAYGKES